MRIDALHSFVTLVKAGSYAATADLLYMSPTTIHGHIRALEEELGTPLVTFSGRTLRLTLAGNRFLLFAERTLEDHSQMEADISGLGRRSAARLRVVSLPGPSVHLLPPVIRAFHHMRQDAVVSVSAQGVGECVAALVSGQADIAVLNDLHTAEVAGSFGVTSIYEDALQLVIRGDCYSPPDIELLAKYPLATQGASSAYRRYVERWARQQGITINAAYEHTSFDGILAFVLQGDCIGMMVSYTATMHAAADRVRILDLPGFEYQRKLIAAHALRPDPLTTEFIRFFRDFYDEEHDGRLHLATKNP